MFALVRGLKAFTMLDASSGADAGTVSDDLGGLSGYTNQTDGIFC
jgi:hypothetical protein